MAPRKRKPALWGTGSLEFSNRTEAFETSEYSAQRQEPQDPRIAFYRVTPDLMVEDFRHG
jgi:hypothetical protein